MSRIERNLIFFLFISFLCFCCCSSQELEPAPPDPAPVPVGPVPAEPVPADPAPVDPAPIPVEPDPSCPDCGAYGFCVTPRLEGNCSVCDCPKGFEGECCEVAALTGCDNTTCPSDGNKHFECLDHGLGLTECVCQTGWSESNCDWQSNPCDPNPCFNGGTCHKVQTATTATSTTPQSSTFSSTKSSTGTTNTKSSSSSSTMMTSTTKTSTISSTPSSSSGTTQSLDPAAAFYCSCESKFTGKWCETKFKDCNWDDCKACKFDPKKDDPPCNNGTCVYDGYNKRKCQCDKGFKGSKCDEQIPDKCADGPCQHGGQCTSINDGTDFRCKCLDIWTSKDCSIYNVCSAEKCLNGGTCESLPDAVYLCHCAAGYTGKRCTIEIDECEPEPCMYNSTCTDKVNGFDCDCVVGTSGDRCEINFDDCQTGNGNPCRKKDNQAECVDGVNSYSCLCSPEYTDSDCTMSMVVWDVIKNLDEGVDIIGVLEDIVSKPAIIKDLMPFFLALMLEGDQSQISWNYDDMFLWAAYERNELSEMDFSKKYDSSLGNCFTFNSPNGPMNHSLRYSGEANGFSALLRVRQDEYLSWIDTAAILVFIHDPSQSIFSESVRYQAPPSGESTFMVSQDSFVRLGGKYGKCIEDKSEVKSYYYGGAYTVDGCLRSCFQDAVAETCDCYDPRYPMPADKTECSLNQRNCVLNVTDVRGDPSNWEECECPVACKQYTQNVRWTTAAFPAMPVDCARAKLINTNLYNDCLANYRDLAQVSVYFPKILQNSFVETPKTSLNQLISYTGGMVGVFTGFSIMTGIELIFLVYRLFLVICLNKSATRDDDSR